MTQTEVIDHARGRKAAAIATSLRQAGISAADVAGADQAVRDHIARTCGQRTPSPITWALALGLMLEDEAGADPFAGLTDGAVR